MGKLYQEGAKLIIWFGIFPLTLFGGFLGMAAGRIIGARINGSEEIRYGSEVYFGFTKRAVCFVIRLLLILLFAAVSHNALKHVAVIAFPNFMP